MRTQNRSCQPAPYPDLLVIMRRSRTRLKIFAAYLSMLMPMLSTNAADGFKPTEIQAQIITAFDPQQPARVQFGGLTFRGGLILESRDADFGGLSGFRVMEDGEHFLAVTDRGAWLRGRIVYRGTVPMAIADAEMAPLLGPDGRSLKGHRWQDIEALAVQDGIAYVGIEGVNQIVKFEMADQGIGALGHPIAAPPGMKLLPRGQGPECLEIAPKESPLAGTLIVISERGLDSRGNLKGFLTGATKGLFSLKRSDDFDVTDCAATPNGKLLVLERRFSWMQGLAIRIRAVPLAAIIPGALVDGADLLWADLNQQIDNLEGLSVHRGADGAFILTLISDDNFSPLQRTLLLQFTLPH